jgi:hypothetical protein
MVAGSAVRGIEPRGHLQVKPDRNGRGRSYWAYWTDAEGKHGRRLGPAHVKDSGRRTPRGAIVWRAGDGSKPSPEHLVPKQAAFLLEAILRDAPREVRENGGGQLTLAQAYEGMLAAKQAGEGLKRTTSSDYDWMAERVFRELGAETPVSAIGASTVVELFDDLRAERVVGAARAERERAAGKEVGQISTEALYAWPPGTRPVEAATKQEAIRSPTSAAGPGSIGAVAYIGSPRSVLNAVAGSAVARPPRCERTAGTSSASSASSGC